MTLNLCQLLDFLLWSFLDPDFGQLFHLPVIQIVELLSEEEQVPDSISAEEGFNLTLRDLLEVPEHLYGLIEGCTAVNSTFSHESIDQIVSSGLYDLDESLRDDVAYRLFRSQSALERCCRAQLGVEGLVCDVALVHAWLP